MLTHTASALRVPCGMPSCLLQVGRLVRGNVFSYGSPLPPPPKKKTYGSFQFIWFFPRAVQTIQMFVLALKFCSYVAFILGHFSFWHC